MSRVELGLLGSLRFPEPSVLSEPLGETWISRAAVRMVLVPVIGASWWKAGGRVVASELPCPRSRELVGLEPGPVAVVVVLALALVQLLGLAGLVPLVSDPACCRAVSSIPGSQWDFRSVACSFPIVKRSSRIFFLQM